MKEDNPFETKEIAELWIKCVEGEKGMIRDNESYPNLASWFNSTPKGTVLDIGSGQGVCCSKIEGYSKYIGVEPSTFLTDRAKELYASSTREFLMGDAYNLPVLNNSCDNVFSINVWFHLEDLDKASRELSRVLKQGGKFFIHTADSDVLDLWKKFYINPSIDGKKILGEVEVPINNMSVNTFYMHTNDEVIKSLEKFGLEVSKVFKIGMFREGRTLFVIIEGEKK